MSRTESSLLLDASGRPITIGRIVPDGEDDRGYAHNPDVPTHWSLATFAEWRRTKCQARDYAVPQERARDTDQAIHELAGEVGEIAELVHRDREAILTRPEGRAKILDEAGDVLFCASWLGDAAGYNFFVVNEDIAPNDLLVRERAADAARLAVRAQAGDYGQDDADELVGALYTLALQMSAHAGLISNAYKKVRWQKRPQSMEVLVGRLAAICQIAAELLALAGHDVEDALARNIEKLDARFPRGYQPGVGGGNRTGKGA